MPHPYIWNLGAWGYPKNGEPVTYYKCRVHGIVVAMVRLEVHNKEYELVFDRRYCSICFDIFLQRHLDPLTPVTEEEFQNERQH